MSKSAQKKKKTSFFSRHLHLKHILIGLLVIVLVIIGLNAYQYIKVARHQKAIEPFYDTSNLNPVGELGEVVRQEPLGVEVEGGEALRILYRTQRSDGSPTFSSGMVFIPSSPTLTPRPVVAWAHGTLGLGDQCAPSRTNNPISYMSWVSEMLKNGWVVTATDYAGFGTPGIQGYLVGSSEAHDVLNSVRAVRNIPEAGAGNSFALWGHSQGGNSVLFSAQQAKEYSPELKLVGTVSSAPAAELVPLLNEQYHSAAGWVIGPLVAVSWPAVNPNLQASSILTEAGQKSYQEIAEQCISRSAWGGIFRNRVGLKLFSTNPADNAAWREMAQQQSGPILAADQPLMVVESQSDQVVLPDTTSLYIRDACENNSNIATLWLNQVSHQDIPAKSAPDVIGWISARFNGVANANTCDQVLPVAPYGS